MKYEYFPEPDPDLEPVSPLVKKRVLYLMHASRRRRLRVRLTVLLVAGMLLIGATELYVRTYLVETPGQRYMPYTTSTQRPPPRLPKPRSNKPIQYQSPEIPAKDVYTYPVRPPRPAPK